MPTTLETFAQDEGLLPKRVDARRYLDENPPEIESVIPGLIDIGDKFFIVGPSKVRKSFFTLQMAICIAAGEPFLGWPIYEPKRVVLIQYELREAHYWRRVRRVAGALGITADDLDNRLQIVNARGNPPKIDDMATDADIVIVDPLYKLFAATRIDENAATEVGAMLGEVDGVIETSACAALIVHHSAKGRAGDRDAIDRAAGSGVVARDFDGCLTLVPHRKEPDAVVVEPILRNYRSPDPFTIIWTDGCFERRDDIPAEVETSRTAANKAQTGPSDDELLSFAAAMVVDKPVPTTEMQQRIRQEKGAGRERAKGIVSNLAAHEKYARWKKAGFGAKVYIGLAENRPKDAINV